MVVVVCYVDRECLVKERFLGMVNVKETSAKSLMVCLVWKRSCEERKR